VQLEPTKNSFVFQFFTWLLEGVRGVELLISRHRVNTACQEAGKMPQGLMYQWPCQGAASVPKQRDDLLPCYTACAPRPWGPWTVDPSHPSGLADEKYKQFISCLNLQRLLPVGTIEMPQGLSWEMNSYNDFQKPVTVHAVPRADDSVNSSCRGVLLSTSDTRAPQSTFCLSFCHTASCFYSRHEADAARKERGANSCCPAE